MSDSIPVLLCTLLALFDAVIFLYTSYLSFEIRNVLAVKLYRRRALWVAGIGAYFVAFFIFATVANTFSIPDETPLSVITGIFAYAGGVAFFVWINSTINVSRRSDPLRRDSLHWSQLRWFFGFLIFVGTFFGIIFNLTTLVEFVRATPLYGPVGLVLLVGGIATYRSATRSADIGLRTHLRWFGLFAILAWATTALESGIFANVLIPDQTALDALSYAIFLIGGYALYRSARSLLPASTGGSS
jgi:predicted small integral membrane protein